MGVVVWGGVRTVVLLVRLVGLANSRQFGAVLRCGRILVQIQFEADVLNLRLLAMGTKRSENAKLLLGTHCSLMSLLLMAWSGFHSFQI